MQLNLRKLHQETGLALVGILLFLPACHEYVNPWNDDTAGSESITTASVEGAAHQRTEQLARTRKFASTLCSPQDGTIGHFPLWWEDPFEDRGSDDGRLAWTWVDYFAMPYGLSRYIFNTMAVPISATIQPPVPLMGSDGVTSRQMLGLDHDAQWLPSGVSPTPPDILEIGEVPPNANESGA